MYVTRYHKGEIRPERKTKRNWGEDFPLFVQHENKSLMILLTAMIVAENKEVCCVVKEFGVPTVRNKKEEENTPEDSTKVSIYISV